MRSKSTNTTILRRYGYLTAAVSFICDVVLWSPDPEVFLLEPSGPTKNKNHLKIGHNDNSSISYWAEPSLPAGIYVGDQNLPSGLGWQSAYEKC